MPATYDTIKPPPGPEVIRHFKILSLGAMKAFKSAAPDGHQAMYLEGIASSTVRDRHGDVITANAQAQMLEAAKGLTMWLNHSYNVPEDILGTCEESSLVSGQDAESNDCLDLTIRCRIDANNPRAVKTWQHINGGTQLGFSIGGEITEFTYDEENDDGNSWCPPMIIDGLALYEISCVGIPANPRAYTRSFLESMSRGFMRTVARDKDVRDVVMKTFAARHGARAVDIASIIANMPHEDELRAIGRAAAIADLKEMLVNAADGKQQLVLAIAIEALENADKAPHESVAGEATCAFVDGCDKLNAAGSLLCEEHMAASPIGEPAEETLALDADRESIAAMLIDSNKRLVLRLSIVPGMELERAEQLADALKALAAFDIVATKDVAGDEAVPPEETHAKVASAIKSLNLSMTHGMCTESMGQTTAAHAVLASMLPDNYPIEDVDPALPDDPADDDVQNSLKAAKAKLADLQSQVTAIEDYLVTRQAELDQISSTATQRAADATASEAKKAQLDAEIIELQKTIDTLLATPTGRQTTQAGGSSGRASYVRRTETASDARKRLGEKLAGVSGADDPALRPA